MPPFQGVGGGVNTRVHQVVEHVRQRVVDKGEGALQINVGFALHWQRKDEGPVSPQPGFVGGREAIARFDRSDAGKA